MCSKIGPQYCTVRAVDPLRGGLSVEKLSHEGSKFLSGLMLLHVSGSWVWTDPGPGGISL